MSTRYQELVIEGPRGWALGFLQGFLRGRGADGRVLDAEEEGFDCEPLRERIRELLSPAEILHLLAPASLVPLVQEATKEAVSMRRTMTIRHERPVSGARFTFSFSIYSREHAARVRGMFEPPADGLRLSSETKFKEKIRPDARGVEMYAPIHDYELNGSGAVEGDVEAVLGLYRRCRHEELIHLEPAELLADLPAGQ